MSCAYLDKSVPEILPPSLDATAEQPPLFDGITKLYTCYTCPYAQRVWIARNFKGLQDEIKLVPLILQNRPAWYSEKVYPPNKGLDLIKYLESNFQGPSLLHEDPAKKEFTAELLSYTDTFNRTVFTAFKGDMAKEAGPAFDHLENALHKFDDGPFFLGQEFSLVDIAYITFVEGYYIFLSEVFKYDITAGRPKLAAWIEEVNKIEAYTQTKIDPKEMVETYKNKFMA
ncbi:In2-1 family protein [Salix suchowensis]|nr:In2-1 family protein [Salix suchowensis]